MGVRTSPMGLISIRRRIGGQFIKTNPLKSNFPEKHSEFNLMLLSKILKNNKTRKGEP